MALIIQSTPTAQLKTDDGQTYTELYGRTDAILSVDGNEVYATPSLYIDEDAFINGAQEMRYILKESFTYPYDRATDGVDILSFANEKAKATLEGMGFNVIQIPLNA